MNFCSMKVIKTFKVILYIILLIYARLAFINMLLLLYVKTESVL